MMLIPHRRQAAVVAVGILLIWSPVLYAKPPERVYFTEDGAPVGAIVRLGVMRLTSKRGSPSALAISRDGRFLAAVGAAGSYAPKGGWMAGRGVHVLDLRTRLHVSTMRVPHIDVKRLAFSPDGTLLAIGGAAKITICKVKTGSVLCSPKLATKSIRQMMFAPDGKSLIVGGGGAAVQVFDTTRGALIKKIAPPISSPTKTSKEKCRAALLSPDKRRILFIASRYEKQKRSGLWRWRGDTLRMADRKNGKVLWEKEDWLATRILEFSPDGSRLAAATSWISVYDAATGKELNYIHDFACNTTAMRFSPTNNWLASVHPVGKRIHVWNRSGKKKFSFRVATGGASAFVKLPIVFTADGKHIHFTDGVELRTWHLLSGKEIRKYAGHRMPIRKLAFVDGDKTLLTACADLHCRWSTNNWKNEPAMAKRPSHGSAVLAAAFRRKRCIVMNSGVVELRESADGKTIRRLAKANVNSIAQFSQRETTFLVGFARKNARSLVLYDSETGRELGAAAPNKFRNRLLALHERTLVYDAGNGILARLDFRNGKSKRLSRPRYARKPNTSVTIADLTFSPDGRFAAASEVWSTYPKQRQFGLEDNVTISSRISVWELRTGRLTSLFEPQSSSNSGIQSFCFSPDNRLVAVAPKYERAAVVHEIASGKMRARYSSHKEPVTAVGFSHHGKWLATGSKDTSIVVWDVRNGSRTLPADKGQLDERQLLDCWHRLGQLEADQAAVAIRTMIHHTDQSIPFLAQRLKPAPPGTEKQIQRWIADLDSDHFRVRERARRALLRLAERAVPAMETALNGRISLEMKLRLEKMLERIGGAAVNVDDLRHLRGLEILEHAGTKEAVSVLQRIAAGQADARLTIEARASLNRLNVDSLYP